MVISGQHLYIVPRDLIKIIVASNLIGKQGRLTIKMSTCWNSAACRNPRKYTNGVSSTVKVITFFQSRSVKRRLLTVRFAALIHEVSDCGVGAIGKWKYNSPYVGFFLRQFLVLTDTMPSFVDRNHTQHMCVCFRLFPLVK
jgi:hypothetical protein